MGAIDNPAGQDRRRIILALQLVVLALAALRLFYDIAAFPSTDEAYYWMWGQHPDWSYFDHPPLHAWLLGIISHVFGWTNFAVRALTWLTLGIVVLIFRSWAPRLAPEHPRLLFWTSLAIYLASPFFFAMTGIAYNDHLLVAMGLLALHCTAEFAARFESGARPAWRWLYAAAIALGLATLTKYSGLVIGIAMALLLLLRPKLRPALATPHPWLAALIAIAMQVPVIVWNAQRGFPSFRFHLEDRWGGGGLHLNATAPSYYLALNLLALSPFLVWPLIRALRARPTTPFAESLKPLAAITFATSSLGFLAVTALLGGYFYWNILAFPALIPLIARQIGTKALLWSHLAYGLVIAALLTVNFSVMPIAPLLGGRDNGSAINIGWDDVSTHLRAAQTTHPADMVGATRFSTTSQVGFALGTTDVVPFLADHPLQWQYWIDPQRLAGKSALILADEADDSPVIAYLKARFTTLATVDSFEILRAGRVIYRWRILRGEGYIPPETSR